MKIKSAEFVTSAVQPSQYPPAELPEFAFSGRSNVGKSSLINTLVNRKKLVQTSSTPGKTRLINFFRVNDALMLVDLPGYGYARVSEAARQSWRPMIEQYLSGRKTLKAVIVILDARRDPAKADTQLLDWLAQLGLPRIIAVTKCDKLSKTALSKQVGVIAQGLALPHEELVLFSAKTHQGRDVLWRAISTLAKTGPISTPPEEGLQPKT
jgi:GTP-binding protein